MGNIDHYPIIARIQEDVHAKIFQSEKVDRMENEDRRANAVFFSKKKVMEKNEGTEDDLDII